MSLNYFRTCSNILCRLRLLGISFSGFLNFIVLFVRGDLHFPGSWSVICHFWVRQGMLSCDCRVCRILVEQTFARLILAAFDVADFSWVWDFFGLRFFSDSFSVSSISYSISLSRETRISWPSCLLSFRAFWVWKQLNGYTVPSSGVLFVIYGMKSFPFLLYVVSESLL